MRQGRRTLAKPSARAPVSIDALAEAITARLGVKLNATCLRPAQLVWMLNSTAVGEAANERQIRKLVMRAGARIGSPHGVHFVRYVAWLLNERNAGKSSPAAGNGDGLTGYDAHRERARARIVALSKSGRDIAEAGWIHETLNVRRRRRGEKDFRFFCEKYFPATFHLRWSDDHLKVIAKIETAVLHGGLFAMAMPRGSGKTSLCEIACLWSLLYGHREFVALIGADEEIAVNMLDSIKVELETNGLIEEDFSEVVGPIRALEGIHQRAGGQLYKGEQTHMGWKEREIILATIPGSRASGAIIRVAGITGRIRGMKHKRVDGTSIRPSLVLPDDPQTDESARSPTQCATRERILAGAILGLAGPGRKIAGLMPCTVIRPDDLADRLLNREKHPQWQGERTKMMYAFPTNTQLWEQYAAIREEELQNGRGLKKATAFYRKHRKEMDAGAIVAWQQRFNPDEASAIQHAMNLRLQDKEAFFAEYQNEPLPETPPDTELLTADQIAAKTSGYERGTVPIAATNLTAMIDVQGNVLYWMVVTWETEFSGYIVDYGTEPDQKTEYFAQRDVRRTLKSAAKGAGLEGAIYAGLERLTDALLGREWDREGGLKMRIERCLVDANWGDSTDVVYQFCRQSKYAGLMMPSHGRGITASMKPFSEYVRKPGERLGLNWRMPLVKGRRAVRYVLFDANFWKSFVHRRLAVAMGDAGCLSLFGREPRRHRLIAEHLTAEYRVRTSGRGREVDEWQALPNRDNHWLDCLVGAAVAASMVGVALPGLSAGVRKSSKRRKMSLAQAMGRN